MRYKCAIIKVIDIVVDILGRGFMMDPKRKRLYMIIGAVIAIVIAVAAGYLYYMRTPTYTLRTIGNAVKTHDWASFQKHVDVKGIFNNTYDRMIESEAEAAGTGCAVDARVCDVVEADGGGDVDAAGAVLCAEW